MQMQLGLPVFDACSDLTLAFTSFDDTEKPYMRVVGFPYTLSLL